jgi:hypothetical protein
MLKRALFLVAFLLTSSIFISEVEAGAVRDGFESWAGSPPLPEEWYIYDMSPIIEPNAIHQSTSAYRSSFALRLGGENTSEVGWDLNILLAHDPDVSGILPHTAYRPRFYAFGWNPWGNLTGGIVVQWLNSSYEIIVTDNLYLPSIGVSGYQFFGRMIRSPSSGVAYARLILAKESQGFINFDEVKFSLAGDLNCDGKVNIVDIAALASWCRRWDPELDLDMNGVLNIIDVAMVAIQFGLEDC